MTYCTHCGKKLTLESMVSNQCPCQVDAHLQGTKDLEKLASEYRKKLKIVDIKAKTVKSLLVIARGQEDRPEMEFQREERRILSTERQLYIQFIADIESLSSKGRK